MLAAAVEISATQCGAFVAGCTEAAGRAEEDLPLLAEDFAAVRALLAAHAGRIPERALRGFTLVNYMAAASWVASRGFGVDDVHGEV